MNTHIKQRLLHLLGLPLVYTGVLLLVVGYFAGWLHHLGIGLVAIALIVAGIVGFVIHIKHQTS